MKNTNGKWLIIGFISIVLSQLLFANNVIEDPTLLYKMPATNSLLWQQKITLNRQFNNIYELRDRLNMVSGINVVIKDQSNDAIKPITVVLSNGSIIDLVNASANKLGFNWQIDGGTVIFKAIHSKPLIMNNPTAITVWKLRPQDQTLRHALEMWCKDAGWQLIWNVNTDYPIVTAWNIQGTFESAVNKVLIAAAETKQPLHAIMHDANKVLEIYAPQN